MGSVKGRCKRDSRTFKCAANHLSLTSPFQNKKEWCRIITNKNCDANNVCINIDDNNERIKTSPWLKRDELIDKQHDKIELLDKKVHRLQNLTNYHARKCDVLISHKESSNVDIDASTRTAIEKDLT